MKQITRRPYRVEDMVSLLAETEPETETWIRERHIRTAETRMYGPAFSFFDGDCLIACAGLTVYWHGCGEAWLAPGKCWLQYAKEAVIWTRRILDELQEGCKRIQADVVASDTQARRFVKHYGFVEEGRMKAYDVLGRDCIRYARVRQ